MKTTQVATLFCCLFLIGSAEVVAGPMMGAMSADLGVRSSAIAYLPAAYGLAYGAFALIAGPLSDRWAAGGRCRPGCWASRCSVPRSRARRAWRWRSCCLRWPGCARV